MIANPTNNKATVARRFDVNVNSLKSTINRDYLGLSRGPRNQILSDKDIKAIYKRIKFYLMYKILSTFENIQYNRSCKTCP